MSRIVRRVRGSVLRIVRRRALSVVLGLALAVPAAWVQLGSIPVAWWVEGLSFVLGATGVAFVWTGVAGLRPDWVDEEGSQT